MITTMDSGTTANVTFALDDDTSGDNFKRNDTSGDNFMWKNEEAILQMDRDFLRLRRLESMPDNLVWEPEPPSLLVVPPQCKTHRPRESGIGTRNFRRV